MNEQAASEPVRQDRAAAVRRSVGWMLAGMLLGLVVTLVIVRWRLADRTPALTEESFRAARELWKQKGLRDYNIEIRVEGPQPAVYRAEVRGGEAVAAFRNGKPLAQRRTFGTWSVPGMFNTISRDLEQLARHRSGSEGGLLLTLRAQFDPATGYPARYVRMERRADVTWEVTKFEAIAPGERGAAGGQEAENVRP